MTEGVYNDSERTDTCACGADKSIARRRDHEEVEYLNLEEGCSYVDSNDYNIVSEWVYYCFSCGGEASDLEELLGWKDEEGDDDDD